MESANPMVDIYDDVFSDIDPTYSTIPDMHSTNYQQRYSVYMVFKNTHTYARRIYSYSLFSWFKSVFIELPYDHGLVVCQIIVHVIKES